MNALGVRHRPCRASGLAELHPGGATQSKAGVWLSPITYHAALMQGLHYGHKLLPGQHQSAHYGLLLAPVVSYMLSHHGLCLYSSTATAAHSTPLPRLKIGAITPSTCTQPQECSWGKVVSGLDQLSAEVQVGMLEEVTQEAHRIAELVEQADSRAADRSATEEAEELRAGARPLITADKDNLPNASQGTVMISISAERLRHMDSAVVGFGLMLGVLLVQFTPLRTA